MEAPDWSGLTKAWPDGRLKLAWTRHLLALRSRLPDIFVHGGYQPLDVRGPHADHVIAFARTHGRTAAIVVVGRHFAPFTQGGRDWPAPPGFEGAVDISGYTGPGLDGNELPLAQALRDLPVAVIEARSTTAAKRAPA